METRCIPADQTGIIIAAEAIKAGQVVGIPTETVYGLGADAMNPAAVLAIFKAKGRPADNPLIVHVLDKAQARELAQVPPLAESLMDAFWPGPLTLILPKLSRVPDVVTAGLSTVALRAPSHPAMRAVIAQSSLPIAAPSANRSGYPSPTTAAHVLSDLNGRIPLVLDGGVCDVGLESTVVDATGRVPRVLRPGFITPKMLAAVAGECLMAGSAMRPLAEGESAPSPGMRHRHYAPAVPLTLVKGTPDKAAERIKQLCAGEEKPCVMALANRLPAYEGLEVLNLGDDLNQAAHRLFHLLRQADKMGCSHLYAEALPEEGLGLALMNRLVRAADFHVVNTKDLIISQEDTNNDQG